MPVDRRRFQLRCACYLGLAALLPLAGCASRQHTSDTTAQGAAKPDLKQEAAIENLQAGQQAAAPDDPTSVIKATPLPDAVAKVADEADRKAEAPAPAESADAPEPGATGDAPAPEPDTPPMSPEELAAAEKEAKRKEKAERRAAKERERMLSDPCERVSASEVPLLDDTRELLEEQTCAVALWLDSLFGDGDVEAARRVHGFVEINNTYSQFDGFATITRMRVEADLPNMKNRLSAFVGRENDEDFVRGRSDASELRSTFPTITDQNQWLAGLGYNLPGSRRFQTQFRVGARGLNPPTGFLQARVRYTAYSDDNDIAYLTNTPFWNTRDGFGVTQSFDYSHVLSPRHLLRWYTVGTISERTVGLNWRNSLILYQNLKKLRGLAYEAFIRGETDEPEPLYEYGGRVLFRHPAFKQRLFLEWAAGYSFPRDDPAKKREGSANAGLSFQLPFGQADR